MVKKSYDVIIVGAGLGGLKLAELLNNSKLNVLLIEKRSTIKTLTKNYFGTFLEYIQRWKLQKYLIYKCGWGFYTTRSQTFKKLKGKSLCVLEMNKWTRSLKLKCDKKTNIQIVKLKREKEQITLYDQKNHKYTAKLVVDCSGIAQTISTLLGIKKSKCDFLNYVFIMKNHKSKNRNEMFYFQDSNLTNCGGWFHTLENGKCLVGCAEFTGPNTLGKKELRKRLISYVKNFYPLNKYLKNAKIIEEFCMAGPTTTMHSSIVEDNYIAVGDAAGAGGPFIGDGFRMTFAMADSAYDTIKEVFKLNDFSKRALQIYSKKFNDEFGKWYKWSYLWRFMYLRYTTNKELNLFTEKLKKFNDQDYYDILVSKLTPKILIKLFTAKSFFLLIKNMFIFHILEPLKISKLPRRPIVLKK